MFDKGRDDRDVGVEFDLAGEVEDDEVFFGEGLEGVGEEVKVLEEVPVVWWGQSESSRCL